MGEKINAVLYILRNTKIWVRILATIVLLGAISALILLDWEVQCGSIKCGTHSNINVDIKR